MGRKKKKPIKPWCWYCNREFDDDKILTQHQRAKHYKCPFCHKKLYSGPGLTVHCVQVHKERLDKIPEALPNRNSVDIDIYGMQGIPEEDLREHERLKRGDDGRSSKPEQASKQTQSNKSQQATNHHHHHQQQPNHFGAPPIGLPPGNPMHAAMLQHAMSAGMMPPGFPMFLPGAPMSLPPGFMPPTGFPGMPPPPMHPGMPPPNQLLPGLPPPVQMIPGVPPPNFPPMLPPTSSGSLPKDWPGLLPNHPPPPPPPPPSEEASTSDSLLPPPMSGVGRLIGVPPPNFKHDSLPPPIKPQGDVHSKESEYGHDTQRETSPRPAQSPKGGEKEAPIATSSAGATNSITTASTIARSAVITKSDKGPHLNVKNYIEVPSAKARIMHPDRDLSFEEIRLGLTKYKTASHGDRLLRTETETAS